MEHIRSFFKIERGEELAVFLLFLYLTLVLAFFTIARAVRDSALLHQYGAMDLPYVYIGIAVIISFVVSLYVRLASRLNQGTLINATHMFFTGNILILLATISCEIQLNAGEKIFAEGEIADALYIIVEGKVELRGSAISGLLGPYEAFGICAVLSNEPRYASARALEDTFALKIRAQDFI